jgi:hypothetical protein
MKQQRQISSICDLHTRSSVDDCTANIRTTVITSVNLSSALISGYIYNFYSPVQTNIKNLQCKINYVVDTASTADIMHTYTYVLL